MSMTDEFSAGYTCEAPDYLPEALKNRLAFLSCLREKDAQSVYLVTDSKSGEELILKTGLSGPNNLEREYSLLSKLEHPGIPRAVYYKRDESEREYLLRSYAVGDTLKNLLERDGVFSPRQTMEIALELCGILNYLHSQKPPVIYRDITPDNVVITPNGKLSLIDFGISREDSGDKGFDTVYVGSAAFASPEQYGFTKTDSRSDIFAAGKLMLYLCTGETDLQSIDKVGTASLRSIIAKCTQLSPEKRYASVSRLSGAIARQLFPPTRREYLTAALCMLLVVAIGLFAGLRLMRPEPGSAPSSEPVSAAGDEYAGEVKIPVQIEVLYNGAPFSACAVAVDNHHWFEPAKSGRAELQVYAYDNYAVRAATGNRTAIRDAAVLRGTETLSVTLDLALTPAAPEFLSLSLDFEERHEVLLDIEGADEVILSGQPNGVSIVKLDDEYHLLIEAVEQPGHYTVFAECSNEYGIADTVISFTLTQEKEPVLIRTAQELDRMREDLSGTYALANDIDLSGFSNWTPIGSVEYPFTGVLEGNGFEISGLTVYGGSGIKQAGLFGCCSRAIIRGVVLREPEIQSMQILDWGVGAIAGHMDNGLIENCAVFGGSVSADISYYGNAGGICGTNTGIITNCFNSADVTVTDSARSGTDSCAGGISGESVGYIANSGNSGAVSGPVLAGGIAGFCETGSITRCYNAGYVLAPVYAGEYPPGGIVHLLGRGKRISYCVFEAGTAPVGATVWNRGTLLSILPLTADEMQNAEMLQSILAASGYLIQLTDSPDSVYPVPVGVLSE